MNSKERVLAAIRHEESDRIPFNVWMFRDDVRKAVISKYGSLDHFFERFRIDTHMVITPPPCLTNLSYLEENMNMQPEDIRPEHWLDPDDPRIYSELIEIKKRYGSDKAIFTHVWGVIESIYGFCGIERTLLLMMEDPEFASDLFSKVSEFSARVVGNLLRIGIDVLHITGDVGSNNNMLFSPQLWRDLIAPFDREIIRPAKEVNIPVSLHSCGYCMPIISDWVSMGISVIHPIQESAGMDIFAVKDEFGKLITIHGGLDIRILSKLNISELEEYIIPRVERLKKGGGFIFNTSHTVQMDTSLDDLEKAYDIAFEYGKY